MHLIHGVSNYQAHPPNHIRIWQIATLTFKSMGNLSSSIILTPDASLDSGGNRCKHGVNLQTPHRKVLTKNQARTFLLVTVQTNAPLLLAWCTKILFGTSKNCLWSVWTHYDNQMRHQWSTLKTGHIFRYIQLIQSSL